MSTPKPPEVSHTERDPGTPAPQTAAHGLAALGGWLFRRRTSIPVPIILILLFVPPGDTPRGLGLGLAGAALVAAGELVRLWAVHHIGPISRTRADRLGPLVASGPFRLVRNPLYLGNLMLWTGFALCAHLVWMVVVVVVVIGFEYHAIVRWEEQLLLSRRGEDYRAYFRRVPRWLPSLARLGDAASPPAPYTWPQTFYSERGTLIAIGVGAILLTVKGRLL